MNATALYVSTCRYILQADFENSESWADLYRLLPYLRQSLSCCVCGALLVDPQGPTDSNCQHFVCRTCLGKKMVLKPSCSWCKDYGKFAEVPQLKILLSCYKKLCEYIAATPIARSFVGANGESNSTLNILQEGMAIIPGHESSRNNHGKALNVLDILARLDLSKTKARDSGSNSKSSPHADGRRRGRNKRQRERSGGRGASPLRGTSRGPQNAEAAAHLRLDGLCNGLDSTLSDHLDTSDDHSYSASVSNSDTPGVKIKRRRHRSGEHKIKSKKKKKKRDKDKVKGEKNKERKSPKLSKTDDSLDIRQRRLLNLRKYRLKLMKKKSKRTNNGKKNINSNGHRHGDLNSTGSKRDRLVNGAASPRSSECDSVLDTPRKKQLVISGHRALLVKAGKSLPVIHGCRCGTWNRYPGANTCRGNRCPCFMGEKGCDKCRCRGCRNPFSRESDDEDQSTPTLRSHDVESDEGDVDVTNV